MFSYQAFAAVSDPPLTGVHFFSFTVLHTTNLRATLFWCQNPVGVTKQGVGLLDQDSNISQGVISKGNKPVPLAIKCHQSTNSGLDSTSKYCHRLKLKVGQSMPSTVVTESHNTTHGEILVASAACSTHHFILPQRRTVIAFIGEQYHTFIVHRKDFNCHHSSAAHLTHTQASAPPTDTR